jgi:glycogen operon protein
MEVARVVRVHAPQVITLEVVVEPSNGAVRRAPLGRDEAGTWSGVLRGVVGDRYWLLADGSVPLLDPAADDIELVDGRPVCRLRGPWPPGGRLGAAVELPVVYELHVRGFGGTFGGVAARLGQLADLGVDVIELMPVHPFDDRDNYWGYMPIVWGAVHRGYADSDDSAADLAGLCRAAHEVGIAVWLDVVFNHTGEGDETRPTHSLRGLDRSGSYLHRQDGTLVDDSGCGNTVDVRSPVVQHLVLEALERFAAVGVDGFRFDLATILTGDGGAFVRRLGDWAEARGVRLVAEAWDLAAYQVGPGFPDQRWAQWNDRFRDDVRGFLRGEPGLVPAMVQRVSGSPELFPDDSARSVNFVTAHDGLTLHDLMSVTSDRHRSWDCGSELRPQMLRNAFTVLLLSAGTAMFVMGDEHARTQHGHDNPYDVDGPLSWVDWERAEQWRELTDTVRTLIRIRRRAARALRRSGVRCYGVDGAPDLHHHSHSLAWATDGLYVMANMWWEPLTFTVREHGRWRSVLSTVDGREHMWSGGGDVHGLATVTVPPRSITVLCGEEEHR